ncbi:MAG: hypothetical protein ABJM43_07745 [Paracoccaceae bacterium]
MTGTGLLVGILAGIGVIAIIVIVAAVVLGRKLHSEIKHSSNVDNKNDVGFALFEQKTIELLQDAPRGSTVSANFPLPSIEVFVKVSGKRGDQSSYQLEIRMGYKRLDHLELIERVLEK